MCVLCVLHVCVYSTFSCNNANLMAGLRGHGLGRGVKGLEDLLTLELQAAKALHHASSKLLDEVYLQHPNGVTKTSNSIDVLMWHVGRKPQSR